MSLAYLVNSTDVFPFHRGRAIKGNRLSTLTTPATFSLQ